MATERQKQIAGATIGITGGAAAGGAAGWAIVSAARRLTSAIPDSAKASKFGQVVSRFGPTGLLVGSTVIAATTIFGAGKAAAQVRAAGGSKEEQLGAALRSVGGKSTEEAAREATKGSTAGTNLAEMESGAAKVRAERAAKELEQAGKRLNSIKSGPETKASQDAARKYEAARKEAETATESYRQALNRKAEAEGSLHAAAKKEKKDPNASDGKSLARAVWDSLTARDQRFVDTEKRLNQEIERIRAQQDREESRSKAPGRGQGPQFNKLGDELKTKEQELKDLRKEEREANTVLNAAATFAPIGAALSGLAAGKFISGAKSVSGRADDVAKEVNEAGKRAGKLLDKPGVLAGTPAGDRGKALVNDVYARGGAKPAFASPGYPTDASTAKTLFGSAPLTAADKALPAINIGMGVSALAYSQYVETDPRAKFAERLLGGFEIGMGVGQIKALSKASVNATKPSSKALENIDGLRGRLQREGPKAERAITNQAVKGATAKAAGKAQIATNKAKADVAVSQIGRDRMLGAASAETRKLGVERARTSATVGVARSTAKGNVQIANRVQDARRTRAGAQVDASRRARNRGLQTTKYKTDAIGNVYQQPNRQGGLSRAVAVGGNSSAKARARAAGGKQSYVNREGEAVQGTAKQIAHWKKQKAG